MADRGPDFLTLAAPGLTLRTRDRREARIERVDSERGLIFGEVAQFGTCSWNAEGLYSGAPAGAAGPLDLVEPLAAPSLTRTKRVSLAQALNAENRSFCCD